MFRIPQFSSRSIPKPAILPRSLFTMSPASPSQTSISALHTRLSSARRLLALCGAGLSASSGLPTFRGAGGLWRNHDATALATPEAFNADPGLVWLFYAYRRHMALKAQPNDGHRALAKLADKSVKGGVDFLCLSQNVDGLHVRAGHDRGKLRLLHGSLFDIKCTRCDWVEKDNYADPFCPALAAAAEDPEPGQSHPLLDPNTHLEQIPRSEIPTCSKWTSAVVYPAAGYIERARGRGTSVVHVNMDVDGVRLKKGDFVFKGDAAHMLPQLLQPLIGGLDDVGRS
ncbi:hypothetical protein DL546_009889 [Coniochaeta pulveracea]|uniref:Deacetylase sirtuin-type domain-containing protein n=1 Tax=Coniochaeta pulveracea TaxID=177199 RepID=A0A420YN80_9PEZI|nr:hypothetical protein DL546_009889 [Coniochaeta pulveracea]